MYAMAALINESNGLPMDMQRCAADGSDSFTRLPAGYYCVVIVDTTGEYRAKTAHVEVFDPLEFTMNSVVLSDALSGYPGEVKSVVVTATGGKAPLTYSYSGSLPDGLTMTGNIISGTLTTEDEFSGVINVEDDLGTVELCQFQFKHHCWIPLLPPEYFGCQRKHHLRLQRNRILQVVGCEG